jgi:hypothetical protein
MSFQNDSTPRIHLNDGTTTADLPGCTIVYPFRELTPLIALQETHDLEHLVHWALSRGYGTGSIGLTTTWTRDEIQRRLGCRISDDFLQAAQEWLDRTSGGLAAATAYHLWEDVLAQLKSEFAAYVTNSEDRWNGPVDSDGAPCFYTNFYRCERCGHQWQDQWSGTCDDDCPACGGGAHEPFKSIELDMTGAYKGMISAPGLIEGYVKLTEVQWENWFQPGDLLDLGDEDVAKTDERHIWTQVDDPEGDGYFVYPGRHWIDRIGYFIAQHPWDDPQIFVRVPAAEHIRGDHTSGDNSSIGEIAAVDCVTQASAETATHDYEVKFLVRAHVSTESADLGKTAARVHCSAKAFIDPGDQLIELEDVEVQRLEANERNEDGWIIRAIDTAGEKPSD